MFKSCFETDCQKEDGRLQPSVDSDELHQNGLSIVQIRKEDTNALLATHGGSIKKDSRGSSIIIHFYQIPQSPKPRYQQR